MRDAMAETAEAWGEQSVGSRRRGRAAEAGLSVVGTARPFAHHVDSNPAKA
jgi:hypothetical protein